VYAILPDHRPPEVVAPPAEHSPWCEIADHNEYRPAVTDLDGCTSAVRTIALSGDRRASGYLATPPLGGPVRVVLNEAPMAGDRLSVADVETLAASLSGLTALAGDDPTLPESRGRAGRPRRARRADGQYPMSPEKVVPLAGPIEVDPIPLLALQLAERPEYAYRLNLAGDLARDMLTTALEGIPLGSYDELIIAGYRPAHQGTPSGRCSASARFAPDVWPLPWTADPPKAAGGEVDTPHPSRPVPQPFSLASSFVTAPGGHRR
jgi:hypothetical protein